MHDLTGCCGWIAVLLAARLRRRRSAGAARRDHLHQSGQRRELADQDRLRASAQSMPIRPASATREISWHDAKDGGNYTLDRKSGNLTVSRRRRAPAAISSMIVAGWRIDAAAAMLPRRCQITSWRPRLAAEPPMAERVAGVKASVGFVSETGPRKRNEDFAGAVFGAELPRAAPRRGRGDRRRHRRRQGRPRRGRDRGARLSRRILRPARDHGGAARRGHDHQCAQWLDPFAGPAGSRAGRHGLHLHRAGAARPRRPSAACRRHARLSAERRPPDLPDHRPCARRRHRPVARALPRARHRDGGAPRLCRPAGGAARPLPAVQRRRARLPDRRQHRRHPARALRARGYRARAGRGRARRRQHRQLHGAGARRGRAADARIGRYRQPPSCSCR